MGCSAERIQRLEDDMANIQPRPTRPDFFGVFAAPGSNGNTWMSTTYDPESEWFPQIDAIAGIGANLVVWFGDVSWRGSGAITLATYLQRRRELAQYVASKGLYGLTYGAMTYQVQGGISHSQLLEILVEDAALMASFPNQIGYATVDEPWLAVERDSLLTVEQIVDQAAAQYAAVKAVVPANFPITACPNPCGDLAQPATPFDYTGTPKTWCDLMAPYNDFFCFHPFYSVNLSDSSALRAAYPDKPLMMPSSILTDNGASDMALRFSSVMGLVGSNNFRGMGYFLSVDAAPDAATPGLWNTSVFGGPPTSPRTDKIAAFQLNNRAVSVKQHRRYPGKPRLTQLRNWGY